MCRRLKRLFTVILHHVKAPCVQFLQNRMAGIYERKLKLVQKTEKKRFWTFYISSKIVQAINVFGLFIFPQKLCRQLKRLLTVILHHIRAPCVQLCQNRMAGKQKKNVFGLFIFPQKLCRQLKRLLTVILHHIRAPCVQLCQNRMAGIWEKRRK